LEWKVESFGWATWVMGICFQLLWSFKAEVERSNPGSIVDIDVQVIDDNLLS
jgi:hypothetical protein